MLRSPSHFEAGRDVRRVSGARQHLGPEARQLLHDRLADALSKIAQTRARSEGGQKTSRLSASKITMLPRGDCVKYC